MKYSAAWLVFCFTCMTEWPTWYHILGLVSHCRNVTTLENSCQQGNPSKDGNYKYIELQPQRGGTGSTWVRYCYCILLKCKCNREKCRCIVAAGDVYSCYQKLLLTYCKRDEDYRDMTLICTEIDRFHFLILKPWNIWTKATVTWFPNPPICPSDIF